MQTREVFIRVVSSKKGTECFIIITPEGAAPVFVPVSIHIAVKIAEAAEIEVTNVSSINRRNDDFIF